MKKSFYKFLSITALLVLIPSSFSSAQNKLEETNCFDHYQFGSVETQITSNKTGFEKGNTVPFQMQLKNNNDYPIVNGNIYVRVYKKVAETVQGDGDYVVDQWMVEENLNLNSNEEKGYTFTWKVPQNLGAGTYKIATFIQNTKKFNLSGLSFTDDIFSSTYDFEVRGEEGTVEFIKDEVKVNGEDHRFLGTGNMMPTDDQAIITAPLINNTNQTQNIVVKYKTYAWDGLDEDNLIFEDSENITLNSNETKEINYSIKENDKPVNYTKIVAEFNDAKSIINVRTIKRNQQSARINFPAVKKFPIKKGENVELFSCIHAYGGWIPNFVLVDTAIIQYNEENPGFIESLEGKSKEERDELIAQAIGETNDMLSNNYDLIVELKDEEGNNINSFNYSGLIGGDMIGLIGEFEANKDLDKMQLIAQLKDNGGNIVDESIIEYNCQLFEEGVCLKTQGVLPVDEEISSLAIESEEDGEEINFLIIGGIAGVVFLILIILVVIMLKRKKSKQIISIFIALFFSFLVLITSKTVNAKSKNPLIENKPDELIYVAQPVNGDTGIWAKLNDYYLGLEYTVKVEKEGLNIENSELCGGDNFKVIAEYKGTWEGTGTNRDTPPVHWNNGANYEIDENADIVLDTWEGWGFYKHYAPFVFNDPAIEVSGNSISCDEGVETEQAVEFNCTVNEGVALTNVDFSINYNETYGYPYYYTTALKGDGIGNPPGIHPDAVLKEKQGKMYPNSFRLIDPNYQHSCRALEFDFGQNDEVDEYEPCEEEVEFNVSQTSIDFLINIGASCSGVTPPQPQCNTDKTGNTYETVNDLTGGDFSSLCSVGDFDSINETDTAFIWSCVDPIDQTVKTEGCEAVKGVTVDTRDNQDVCSQVGEIPGVEGCCNGLSAVGAATYDEINNECNTSRNQVCLPCGNGTCDSRQGENQCNCPNDCPSITPNIPTEPPKDLQSGQCAPNFESTETTNESNTFEINELEDLTAQELNQKGLCLSGNPINFQLDDSNNYWTWQCQ